MRFLILSGSTGGGHNSAAMAIKDYFEQVGAQCHIKDALNFCSESKAYIINNGHVFIYKRAPKLFGACYRFLEKRPVDEDSKSLMYEFITFGAKGLYKYLKEEKYDAIICTHVFAGMVATAVKKKFGLDLKIYFVATDYTCSPGTYEIDADKFFIPHKLLCDEYEGFSIKKEKLVPSGIPVRLEFYKKEEKEKAIKILGLPKDKEIILLMGGSMGAGPLIKLASLICEKIPENAHLVAICGNNKKLMKELKNIPYSNKTILGYTGRMPLYMDTASIILSKAGGLSSTEALTKHLPLILIDAVPGCETRNRDFLTSRGFAKTADGIENLTSILCDYLENPETIEKTETILEREFSTISAKIIYDNITENL